MAKVIVIMCDTLRQDYLGYYGNQWIHTPFFDKLRAWHRDWHITESGIFS